MQGRKTALMIIQASVSFGLLGCSTGSSPPEISFAPVPLQPSERVQSTRYSILDPQGTVIGKQVETQASQPESFSTSRTRQMSFSIDGHRPVRYFSHQMVFRDGLAGRVRNLTITFQTSQSEGHYTVEFKGTTVSIRKWDGKESRSYTQTIDPEIPYHDPEVIGVAAPKRFYTFDLGTGRLVEQRSVETPMGAVGEAERLAILTYEGEDLVNIWVGEFTDGNRVVSMTRPQVGSNFRFVPQDPADDPVKSENFGRIPHPMLESPNVISESAKRGHIRYRIKLIEPLATSLPTIPEQRVTQRDGGVQLDVCKSCGGAALPTDAASLAKWREPSPWLQSDYAPIARTGARIGARSESDHQKMVLLARAARGRLKDIDLNGHFSARAAWGRRAGDCTEDAIVLAALARAAGIPARVASGVAFTRERYHGAREAFIPHTWVVAYLDGAWQSFDMTTDEGFGAGHLALTLSDGEAKAIAAANLIAGMIQWESLAEVRKRPEV